jgi:hypothetical protein
MLIQCSRHVLFCTLPNRRWEKGIRLELKGDERQELHARTIVIGRGTWKIRGIYSLSVSVFWRAGNVARLSRSYFGRVIDQTVSPPRYFVVGSSVLKDAWQLLRAHSDVGDDKIEAAAPASIPNKLAFEINVGEVKQIDKPYP